MKELTTGKEAKLIIGVDLGDRLSEVCVMDASGEVRARTKLKTTAAGFEKIFRPMVPARIALEVGTLSTLPKFVLRLSDKSVEESPVP